MPVYRILTGGLAGGYFSEGHVPSKEGDHLCARLNRYGDAVEGLFVAHYWKEKGKPRWRCLAPGRRFDATVWIYLS